MHMSSIRSIASVAAVVAVAWASAATGQDLRPEIVVADEAAGCPSIAGAFDSGSREDALALVGRRIARRDGEESAVAWVISEARSYRGRLKDGDGNRPLRELLGDEVPKEVIVIPIIVDRKVAAVLYGDNGGDEGSIGNIGDLERVVARVAREMRRRGRGRD